LFFDFDDYKKFHENANGKNIDVPIYAGIMPLVSFEQAKRFAKVCDISLPKSLSEGFASCNSIEEEREFGIKFIANLCDELIEYGADGLHFYTLNRYKAFSDIYKLIKNKDSLSKGEVRI
jgi:methylenetetrahydrofolate reductase (NADPH)